MNVVIRKGMMENESLNHKLTDSLSNLEIAKISIQNSWEELNIVKTDLMNVSHEWNQLKKSESILEGDLEWVGGEILNALVNIKGENWEDGIW